MELPYDLLHDILLYADGSQMNELCSINNVTYEICQNDTFWMDKIIYNGYDRLMNIIDQHDKYILQNYYNNKGKLFYIDHNAVQASNLYELVKTTPRIQLIVNSMDSNYKFIFNIFNIKDSTTYDGLAKLSIISINGKMKLRFGTYVLDITDNDLYELLFMFYVTKKKIDILKF